jgi:tetratricopeptide (TPR) repeat protein
MAVGTACQVLVILITLQIPLTSASSRHEFIKPQVSLTNATEAKLLEPLPVATPVAATTAQRGSVSGQVLLPSGQQLNFRIRVTLSGYRVASITAYTDNKGRFSIPGISDGTYNLEVQAESGPYATVNQEVRVIYGAHPMLVITLRERGAPNKQNAGVISAAELDHDIPDAARKEYEKGAQYSEKGKIEDAIERFKKALTISPDFLMAHNNLGAQYMKLGKWAEAAKQFEAAIAINAKALNPRQNLAIALIEQKQYAQAIEHLNEALSIDSSSAVAHLYAGIASLGVDEIDQAQRELSTALSLGGEEEYSNAHFFLGLVYMKKGEREPAIREFKTYIEKSPKGEKVSRARELLEKLRK